MRDRPPRPVAWTVLAVALALMALVVALASPTGRRLASPSAERSPVQAGVTDLTGGGHAGSASGAGSGAARTPPAPRGAAERRAGTTLPRASDAGRRHAGQATAAGTSSGPGADPLRSVARSTAAVAAAKPAASASAPPAILARVQAPAVAASTPSASGSVVSTPPAPSAQPAATGQAGPYPGTGRLVPPGTSVVYPAAGGSLVTASATWVGTPSMELTITCPGGVSVSRTGSSGLSVEVDDTGGTGTCAVTLALPLGTSADVTYTLTIEPGP